MSNKMENSVAGHAALSICESLIIAMRDLKIISQKDARDVLTDAASANREAGEGSKNPELHKDVAKLIERILAEGNSLPRI